MGATAVAFWVLGVLAVAAGVAVFRVDSMARATYALAVSFTAVGLALLLVGLDYLGVVVVLMMVMEMAVMAVYMIMFMGMNPALMPMSMVHDNRRAVVGRRDGVRPAGRRRLARAVAGPPRRARRRTPPPRSVTRSWGRRCWS